MFEKIQCKVYTYTVFSEQTLLLLLDTTTAINVMSTQYKHQLSLSHAITQKMILPISLPILDEPRLVTTYKVT